MEKGKDGYFAPKSNSEDGVYQIGSSRSLNQINGISLDLKH